MAVSSSFKFVLAILLLVSIVPKILLGGGVSNPDYTKILEVASPFFVEEGYQVTRPVYFAGKDALLAIKDGCLMYVVPVAHQGWHQAAVRQSVGPSQSLWFEFEGELTPGEQDTFHPLAVYYLRKAARYFGAETVYPPLLAIVTDGDCSLNKLPWQNFPGIPFKKSTFLG